MYIYVADFDNEIPSIVYAHVVNETAKQYHVDEYEDIIGSVEELPSRIAKDRYHCFTGEREAVQFLIEQVDGAIVEHSRALNRLRKMIGELHYHADGLEEQKEVEYA